MARAILGKHGHNFHDLTGKTFGRWTVLSYSHRNHRRELFWVCRCDCGTVRTITAAGLYRGKSRSCGCLKSEVQAARHFKHGQHRSPEHRSWSMMKQRCYNHRDISFANYGRRGIQVCDRWRDSFENFFADMGPRPSLKHSLERIDNEADYTPENCRWATRREQSSNTRRSRKVVHEGKTYCLKQLAEKLGIKYSTVCGRLNRGWSLEEAFTTVKG